MTLFQWKRPGLGSKSLKEAFRVSYKLVNDLDRAGFASSFDPCESCHGRGYLFRSRSTAEYWCARCKFGILSPTTKERYPKIWGDTSPRVPTVTATWMIERLEERAKLYEKHGALEGAQALRQMSSDLQEHGFKA